ncbi:MAG: hypothetical protein ABSF89_01715 [Acidimicrobiales bacterium]
MTAARLAWLVQGNRMSPLYDTSCSLLSAVVVVLAPGQGTRGFLAHC